MSLGNPDESISFSAATQAGHQSAWKNKTIFHSKLDKISSE
jgi:hypothetical protein